MSTLSNATNNNPKSVLFAKTALQKPSNFFLLILAFYLLVYRIATPPLNAYIMETGSDQIALRGISNALYNVTLFSPILFFKRVGFFHPLAFPALLDLSFGIVFQPLHILLPIVVTTNQFLDHSSSHSILLQGLSSWRYAELNIYRDLVGTAFLLANFLGFYLVARQINIREENQAIRTSHLAFLKKSAATYIIFATLGGYAFVFSQGGVEQQILAFYRGRFESLSGLGVFSAPVKTSVVALMVWFATSPTSKMPIFFWVLFAGLVPAYWLVDGSRSSLLLVVLSLIITYSLKHDTIPKRMIVLSSAMAFIVFGLLGMLRQDYKATEVNFSIFSVEGLSDAVFASQNETNKRGAEEGDLAAIQGAEIVQRLNGLSYLAIAAYPIPRAIWENKPKNVYVYVNWVAFQGNLVGSTPPNTWGIPISPATEAYFNFGWTGVIIVGLLVGIIQRAIFNRFVANSTNVFWLVIFIESLLYLNGGSRWAFYFLQNSATLLLIYAVARILERVLRR